MEGYVGGYIIDRGSRVSGGVSGGGNCGRDGGDGGRSGGGSGSGTSIYNKNGATDGGFLTRANITTQATTVLVIVIISSLKNSAKKVETPLPYCDVLF